LSTLLVLAPIATAADSGKLLEVFLVVLELAMLALLMAASWRIFAKAGLPGWAAFIPIYSVVKLLHLCGRSGWWALLLLIPWLGGIALAVITAFGLARAFGRSTRFGAGLLVLPFVYLPILAFGESKYQGPPATF
jgi:uncharacterized membrane protein YhaH (DUF805 family)